MKAHSFSNNQDFSNHRCRSNVIPKSAERSPNRNRRFSKQPGRSPEIACSSATMLAEADYTYFRQIARQKAERGDYAEAIEILSCLIARHPNDANDYNNRGLIYFQCGELESALTDYNKAIQLNPNLAGVYNNRANYYAERGKLTEAIADYDRAIDLNPVHVRAWINQGITFRDLELYDRAIENFDFALRLGHLKSLIWAERGRTYHLMGDWNFAIADYRRALEALAVGSRRQQVENWLNELIGSLH